VALQRLEVKVSHTTRYPSNRRGLIENRDGNTDGAFQKAFAVSVEILTAKTARVGLRVPFTLVNLDRVEINALVSF
jgi:hypothetical protein